MYPHPAHNSSKHPSLATYLWRYFTGQHLDGKARTNATWTKRGTAPSHHVNWWNAKPRLGRMAWRWAMVIIPGGWGAAYAFAPTYGINLMVIITLAASPYLLHHGVLRMMALLPKTTVVYVQDNIRREDVDSEIDEGVIPELMIPAGSDDEIQNLIDMSIEDQEIPTDDARRLEKRRSKMRMRDD